MTAVLFVAIVLIWGASWYPLALQASMADPVAAVLHRIALAALAMNGYLAFRRGRPPRRGWDAHLRFAWLGACLFCFNFIAFYVASRHLPSGLLSVCFATATLWAALFAWIVLGERPSARVAFGGALGVVGLWIVLGDRSAATDAGDPILGVALCLAGSAIFAAGNVASVSLRGLGVRQDEAVARGMLYGVAMLTLAAYAAGAPIAPPIDWAYLGVTAFTGLISSVAAFSAYLALVHRIGPARAAYATVLFPLVALGVSMAFEGFAPDWRVGVGVGLVLLGAGFALAAPGAAIGGLNRSSTSGVRRWRE